MIYKAFIRVVKSLSKDGYLDYFGFDKNIIEEPIIHANNKQEVKDYLKEQYPSFFQKDKVYEKETKDEAQFFYVVIFPLYKWEIELINKGEWVCKHCGEIHQNRYLHKPTKSLKPQYEGLEFCNYDICFDGYKRNYYKDMELPDNESYIKSDSNNYIYKITEKSSGKCYIGKTRNEPFFRWWAHLKHSSSPFGLYLRTTLLSDWTFEVLHVLPHNIIDEEVFKIETQYIEKYDSINNGYNMVVSKKINL